MIKYGDSRIFAESTLSKPFSSPNGIEYEAHMSVARMICYIEVDDKNVSLSLPSMAELIFSQSKQSLNKAQSIKARALKVKPINGTYNFVDEELFYTCIQLMSLGILGLYSALESMVYELYIRRGSKQKVQIDGKELTFKAYTSAGIETKLSRIASQLSGKPNIYETELMQRFRKLDALRTSIQHWDIEKRDDYFINLPHNHPLKVFSGIEPSELADTTREILDHYSLEPTV